MSDKLKNIITGISGSLGMVRSGFAEETPNFRKVRRGMSK